MQIGILAAGTNEAELLESYGSFAAMTEQMFARFDKALSFRTFDVRLGEFPDSAEQCDGWVITGSASSVYDDLPWIKPLEQLIRDIDLFQRPLIGICFGHQIIARAFGARVAKADVGWGLGLHRYSVTDVGRKLLGVATLDLHVIHQDQVIALPAGAERLAGSEFCPNALLRYGSHILTVQAHPEFYRAYMNALLPAITPEYISEAEAGSGLQSMMGQGATEAVLVAEFMKLLRYSAGIKKGLIVIRPSLSEWI